MKTVEENYNEFLKWVEESNNLTEEDYEKSRRETYYDSPEFLKFFEEFNNTKNFKFNSLLEELNEMIKVAELDSGTNHAINLYKSMLEKDGKKIGDQNGRDIVFIRVSGTKYWFGIKENDQIISLVIGEKDDKLGRTLFIVDLAYTDKQFRQQGIVKQLYLWIKNNLKIAISDRKQQSPEAVKFFDNLSRDNNFHVKWYNPKTKEELPYGSNITQFRSEHGVTDWMIIVESNEYWSYGSSRNPYGNINWRIIANIEEDPLSAEQYLRIANAPETYIKELTEANEPDGTYVGVKFSKKTQTDIRKLTKALKIDNPVPRKDLHSTVIFSRKYFKYSALGKIDPPWIGTPTKFEIFETKDDKKALVLLYDCKEQTKQHKHLMKEHSALYDYDEYLSHLTLSYDYKNELPDINIEDYIKEIEIVEEYTEDLDFLNTLKINN